MTSIPFMITDTSLNIFFENRMRSVDKTHMNYEAIKDLLMNIDKSEEIDGKLITPEDKKHTLKKLLDIPTFISLFTEGRVQIGKEGVLFDGKELTGVMKDRLISILNEGLDVTPMAKFVDKLMDNPVESAKEELYLWMEEAKLPITPDGDFLAFKSVRHDYMDHHSGTVRNQIGDTPEMILEDVDTNRNRTCSSGLHFCAWSYIPAAYSFQTDDHIMVLKINPKNVVAIPNDYNNAKGRTWTYEVVGEVPKEEVLDIFNKPVLEEFQGNNWHVTGGEDDSPCEFCDDEPCDNEEHQQCEDCGWLEQQCECEEDYENICYECGANVAIDECQCYLEEEENSFNTNPVAEIPLPDGKSIPVTEEVIEENIEGKIPLPDGRSIPVTGRPRSGLLDRLEGVKEENVPVRDDLEIPVDDPIDEWYFKDTDEEEKIKGTGVDSDSASALYNSIHLNIPNDEN